MSAATVAPLGWNPGTSTRSMRFLISRSIGRHGFHVLRRDQRDRLAGQSGAAGAADAVHVVLGRMRHVEVDHLRQPLDVQPARGDVGGDQHRGLARLEVLERRLALGLRLVAVDRVGVDVVAAQLVREAVRADARAGEDQHLLAGRASGSGTRAVRASSRARPRCSTCVTSSAAALRAATCTSAGSRSSVLIRLRISSGKVAENSRFCRCTGRSAMMRLMSGRNPMSSMRSASSSTRIETWLNMTVLFCTWSSRRPGVATRTSTPLRSCSICAFMSTPP